MTPSTKRQSSSASGPRKRRKTEAFTTDTHTVATNYGTSQVIRIPALTSEGSGYANWKTAIDTAIERLNNDTHQSAHFLHHVLRNINAIFGARKHLVNLSSNGVVRPFNNTLNHINQRFPLGVATSKKDWHHLLPEKAEFFAVYFATSDSAYSKVVRKFLRERDLMGWAEVPHKASSTAHLEGVHEYSNDDLLARGIPPGSTTIFESKINDKRTKASVSNAEDQSSAEEESEAESIASMVNKRDTNKVGDEHLDSLKATGRPNISTASEHDSSRKATPAIDLTRVSYREPNVSNPTRSQPTERARKQDTVSGGKQLTTNQDDAGAGKSLKKITMQDIVNTVADQKRSLTKMGEGVGNLKTRSGNLQADLQKVSGDVAVHNQQHDKSNATMGQTLGWLVENMNLFADHLHLPMPAPTTHAFMQKAVAADNGPPDTDGLLDALQQDVKGPNEFATAIKNVKEIRAEKAATTFAKAKPLKEIAKLSSTASIALPKLATDTTGTSSTKPSNATTDESNVAGTTGLRVSASVPSGAGTSGPRVATNVPSGGSQTEPQVGDGVATTKPQEVPKKTNPGSSQQRKTPAESATPSQRTTGSGTHASSHLQEKGQKTKPPAATGLDTTAWGPLTVEVDDDIAELFGK